MDKFEEIMIFREGSMFGKMETNKIVMILEPGLNYKFNGYNFDTTNNEPNKNEYKIIKPIITTINGEWNHGNIIKSTSLNNLDQIIKKDFSNSDFFSFDSYDSFKNINIESDSDSDSDIENSFENIINKNTFSNILGNNVKLECTDCNYIFKPIIATNENLKYYNCKLIEKDHVINFDCDEKMALFNMSITHAYVTDYIMDKNKGGGIYLEYHNLPHIHIPLNISSKGYIILAKQKKSNLYDVSAFIIPFGKAIYIPPNVIHNDCFLIGDYNVLYGKSYKYSTAILKNGSYLVNFKFF